MFEQNMRGVFAFCARAGLSQLVVQYLREALSTERDRLAPDADGTVATRVRFGYDPLPFLIGGVLYTLLFAS